MTAPWVDCDDPVGCILERPLVSEPGTDFNRSGANTVPLAEIIKSGTGMDIETFSREYVFEPPGI